MATTSLQAELRTLSGFLALGAGSGLAPYAPGTFGSLAALIPWLALCQLPLAGYLTAIGIAFGVGVAVCQRAGQRLGVSDHPAIVWDEWVGMWVTLVFVPADVWWVLVGFVIFRVLDIAKPWPASLAERRLGGGLGVMADDVVAGLMAATALAALRSLIS